MHHFQKYPRNQRGSALSEFGPALMLMLFFAVFPVLDMIFAGLAYCACVTLNDLELREAVKVPAADAMSTIGAVQENWRTSGLGGFAGLINYPEINISYIDGPTRAVGVDKYIAIATTVSVKPVLAIPFFANVPGLGTQITYTVSGKRLLESPSYAPPETTKN